MNPFYKNRRGASVAKQGNLQDRRNMPRATKEPIGKVNLNALDDFDTSSLDKLSRDIFPAHTELDAYNQLASKLGLGPLNQQEYDELQRTGRRPDPSRPPGPGDPSITANPISNESKIINKKLIRLTESDLRNIVKESVKKIINENHFTRNMAHITEDDMINHEINNAKKILQLIDDWKEEKLSPEETVKQMEETIESLRMGLDIFRGASPKAKMKWPNTIGRG